MFSKIRNAALALAAVATLGTATLISTTDSADARLASAAASAAAAVAAAWEWPAWAAAASIGRSLGGRVASLASYRPSPYRSSHPHRASPPALPSQLVPSLASPLPHPRALAAPADLHVRRLSRRPTRSLRLAAAAPRCTCLTKEYTQDGLVVFKDVCTKEVASAPIGNTQTQLQLPAQEQAPTTQQ